LVGLAYNIVANKDFQALLKVATGDSATVLSREAHNGYVDADFLLSCKKVTADVVEAMSRCFGFGFVSLFHDMYSDNAGSSVLGASIAFISKDWQLKHYAIVGQKHHGSHAASDVASAIVFVTGAALIFDPSRSLS